MRKPSKSSPSRKPRALISVSDKTGIVEFAKGLANAGYEIISTGGTAKVLSNADIDVIHAEDVTKFPECFGGRVKTLHPLIAGGILYRRSDKKDVEEAKILGIHPIDVVVVNLYPFAQTLRKVGSDEWVVDRKKDSTHYSPVRTAWPGGLPTTHSEVIEHIDIGGPSLLRAAAKNFESVTVVCDPMDYDRVLDQLRISTPLGGLKFRQELAAKVFAHTAAYDALIAEYLSGGMYAGVMMRAGRELRYGENPHQWGRYYELVDSGEWVVDSKKNSTHLSLSTTHWRQLQGKELSYLNILDADAAWKMVQEFTDPTAVFVKHANPSGVASNETIDDAFQRAYDADRLSAFGVIIALNRACTEVIAKKILDQKMFVELVIAPGFEKGALEVLKGKANIRLLVSSGEWVVDSKKSSTNYSLSTTHSYRSALGGILVQNEDSSVVTEKDLKVVTSKKPTKHQIEDLLFAWKVVKHAKSNAIVMAKQLSTVGIGCGQTSRVDSTWIAAKRAGVHAKDAVLASDAFFPFPDAVEEAAKHGISAVIQPGGSIRDEAIFKRAEELGLVMVITGVRVFRH